MSTIHILDVQLKSQNYSFNSGVIFQMLGWNMSSGLLDLFAIDRKRHLGDKSSLKRTGVMINNIH